MELDEIISLERFFFFFSFFVIKSSINSCIIIIIVIWGVSGDEIDVGGRI